MNTQTLSSKNGLGKAALLALFAVTGLTALPAYAHDNDRNRHRHNDDNRRYECREVVKRYQISRNVTVTETGMACPARGGGWTVTWNPGRHQGYDYNISYRDDRRDYGWADHKKCKKGHNHRNHGHDHDD